MGDNDSRQSHQGENGGVMTAQTVSPPRWLVAPSGWFWCWACADVHEQAIATGQDAVLYFEQRTEEGVGNSPTFYIGVPVVAQEGYVTSVFQWQLNVAEFGIERVDHTGDWWSCRLVGPHENCSDVITEMAQNLRPYISGVRP